MKTANSSTRSPARGTAAGIADPGPLGLAAFALTTFLLSAANAHWTNGNSAGTAFLGYALAYGGIVQLLAGMWEFRNGNVFGATAFSSYGAFWIGLFVWIRNTPGRHRPRPRLDPARVRHLQHVHADPQPRR